jgi:hypothetical protein
MADKKDTEVQFLPPASQVDLDRRLAVDHLPDSVRQDNTENDYLNPEKVVAPYAVEDNDTSGYRGVSPEYMTYANETEKPHTPDEGPEAEAQRRLELGVANVRKSSSLAAEPQTNVGVVANETVNTATSGEGYSAKLVDAPADFSGRASDDVDYAGKPSASDGPSTGTKSTASPAKPATAKPGPKSNS